MVQPPRKSPMAHVGIGFELAIPVALCVFIGYKLDERWGTDPWLVVLGAAIGMTAGFYSLFKRYLPRSTNSEDEDRE